MIPDRRSVTKGCKTCGLVIAHNLGLCAFTSPTGGTQPVFPDLMLQAPPEPGWRLYSLRMLCFSHTPHKAHLNYESIFLVIWFHTSDFWILFIFKRSQPTESSFHLGICTLPRCCSSLVSAFPKKIFQDPSTIFQHPVNVNCAVQIKPVPWP